MAKKKTIAESVAVPKVSVSSKKITVVKGTKKTASVEGKNVLIITEKPQAAEKIAAALSNGTDEKLKDKNGVYYYQFNRDGKSFLVGCAVGHLFGIKQNAVRGEFPSFDVSWAPNYENKNAAYTKKYYDLLKKLSKDCNDFIVATDYDIEGEVIGWNVVRFICGMKDAKRMKFSSLTKDELNLSWENIQQHINWGEAYAGETRHHLDWFYGINLSRGLMRALSKTGKFRILSIGRVQGPALKLVYDLEKEIEVFKPTPYWQIFIRVRDYNKNKLELKYPKDITDDKELARFTFLQGKKGTAETVLKDEKISPPFPFDLTTLQTESYRMCGLTPAQTLQIAQGLYLDGVISYPRTSSQQYPEGIGYDKILKNLTKYTTLTKYAVNQKPIQGPKSDPAHPAIYPTGEMKKTMNEIEKKVYDLIVKRFIACFCAPAIVASKRVTVNVEGIKFYANGMQMKEKNWIVVYPNNYKEADIPTINGEVNIEEIRTEQKMTKPPARYSAASLVKELEKRNLGTKATRANILETLQNRGYITGKSIEVTSLGMKIIDTLKKYSPTIIDEELTREIETDMEKIEALDSGWQEKENSVMEKAKVVIRKVSKDILANLEKIGEGLAEANEELYKQQAEDAMLSQCPICKKGNLRIMFGRKFKRYFVSCSAYPDCKTTFSLPPTGLMKPSRAKNKETGNEEQEFCQECGFPFVIALKKGRRPWKFCFNPNCPSRKRAEEEKKKYLEAKEEKEESSEEKKEKVEDKSHEDTEMN